MKPFVSLIFLLVLTLCRHAGAASLSGIMVYSADDFGHPSGFDSYNDPNHPEMHMWRTRAQAGRWHGLGVFLGPVPDSLATRPLNFPDFSFEFPLEDGINVFTLLGEPGPITWTDDYQRFVLNLYFDGVFEQPGISILFPRFAPADGAAPTENRSTEAIYSFDLARVDVEPAMVYDDGFQRVSVAAVSFLSPDRFVSVNLVDRYALAPGGEPDGIGVLRLLVEPSTGDRPVVGPGPGFQGIPAGPVPGVAVRPPSRDLISPPVTGVPPGPRVSGQGDRESFPSGDPLGREAAPPTDAWVTGDRVDREWLEAETTATPEAEATPEGTGTVFPPTPTPKSTRAVSGTTTPVSGSPTPVRTPTPEVARTRTAEPTSVGQGTPKAAQEESPKRGPSGTPAGEASAAGTA